MKKLLKGKKKNVLNTKQNVKVLLLSDYMQNFYYRQIFSRKFY